MKIENFHNKKIAILGFGKEGQSILRFLLREGIAKESITLLDEKEIHLLDFDDSLEIRTGATYLDSLGYYDILCKSPGISPFHEKILPFRNKIVTSTQIFFENYPGKVIGITGTKGKSTVSTLLYECLKSVGKSVKLVGNIGKPVLDEIDISKVEYEYIVFELSSFMLQDYAPKLHIGYINNISPCHLDWHFDSFNIYREAKINCIKNADIKIIHSDLKNDSEVMDIKAKKIYFDGFGKYHFDDQGFLVNDSYIYQGKSSLRGKHNAKNICGVIAILDQFLLGEEVKNTLGNVLSTFQSLPNRQELVGMYEGITFINDAIATTPESTMAAIETFSPELQTLFLGGEDSGFDFSKLREMILTSSVQSIIAFPDTSEIIFPEIEQRDIGVPFELEIDGKAFQFLKTRSMKAGVDFAFKTTLPGKIALLSSAAPSFSVWDNYLQKAEEFKKEVQYYL